MVATDRASMQEKRPPAQQKYCANAHYSRFLWEIQPDFPDFRNKRFTDNGNVRDDFQRRGEIRNPAPLCLSRRKRRTNRERAGFP